MCIRDRTSTPICVKTEMKGTMAEAIPYKVEEEKTKDLYKGDSYVKQKGADGKRIVNGTIYYENGKEVKRNIKKTTVISEPTTQIVLIGTAERPKTAPTGHFKYPVRNINITSPYGYRWGRLHTGVDLANPIGTPIYASDGGTVTVAGYEGAYGLCVIVDHGNGFKTRYAHCNQLYVSVGDKVYQGQEISATGNTGRSTGPHLHFEIIVNGAPVDPMGYLE